MTELQSSRMQEQAGTATALLQSMANRNRLLILCHLCDGELTVTELMRRVGMNQSALSQQLARLRAANVVSTRRDGQQIHYSLASDEVRKLLGLLYELYCETN